MSSLSDPCCPQGKGLPRCLVLLYRRFSRRNLSWGFFWNLILFSSNFTYTICFLINFFYILDLLPVGQLAETMFHYTVCKYVC